MYLVPISQGCVCVYTLLQAGGSANDEAQCLTDDCITPREETATYWRM